MTFVNLSLLAGAALVAVPIVLHLVMRQKPRRLEFPALRLVARRQDANRRRLRLRHLLLLLLRALAIVLLAAALARPSAQFGGRLGGQEEPVAAALVFDASARMDYRHENATRLEAAKQTALWLLAQLPPESRIAVLDMRPAAAAFQVDRGAARDRVRKLETVTVGRSLTATLAEALRLLGESGLARREVYVFTDLARAAWSDDAAGTLEQLAAEARSTGVYLVDVGVENPVNYALGELDLSGEVVSQRGTLALRTTLSASGASAARSIELRLRDAGGEMVQRGIESAAPGEGGAASVEFRVGSLEVGTHQGLVRILGQDGLPADDVRYFTVEVQPPARLLLAAPKPVARRALYLAEALAPKEFRRRGQARFDCDLADVDDLASRELGDYAAVFLLDPKPLSPAVWQRLGDYVAAGGGLGIFLGREAEQVDGFNHPAAQELLPGRLVRQARRPDGEVHLAPLNLDHPVLAPFRSRAGAVPWNLFPVFRYWQFDETTGCNVIARWSDGGAALVERSLGLGRVLTLATPVSDDPNRSPWNLLPVGEAWPFVILANQMASYLTGMSDLRLNYFAGQTAAVRLDPDNARRTLLLTTPGELTFPLSADPRQPILAITTTEEIGNYRVRGGGTGVPVDRGFSVNLDPAATALERIDAKRLDELLGPLRYRVARTKEQIERDVNLGRVGRELFPVLSLLVAGLLAAEWIVANRFYRE